MKLAAAPISWGVCEVPGWGHQLGPDRVLSDAARLGFHEIELGPPGFFADDAVAARELAQRYGVRIIAAFVTAVLHDPRTLEHELRSVERQAKRLASLGGSVLVLAASRGGDGYDTAAVLGDAEWRTLLAAFPRVTQIASRQGLVAALHPHVGTAIESEDAISRVLRESDMKLCLDTGHAFVGGADPVAIAAGASDRVVHVHLKDADADLASAVREGRMPYTEAVARGLFRPLGDGDAQIARVLSALRDARYDGWYVLEQDIALAGPPTEATDPARDVARSRDFARQHA